MINQVALELIARAGGGGSSGGGGGGGGILFLPIILIALAISWWQRRKRIKKAAKALAEAEAKDPSWNTAVKRAQEVFEQFQEDWSNFNYTSFPSYLTPEYLRHITLMLQALQQMNRRNQVTNLKLTSAIPMSVSDNLDDNQDAFDIEMRAVASDILLDSATNTHLFVDNAPFIELWHFKRNQGQWLLDGISQSGTQSSIAAGYISSQTKQAGSVDASKMRQFALNNGFFYNADFGWLLLPLKGLLFTLSSFGRSDINYHVIGEYRNVLVQFYQYVPLVQDKRKLLDYFRAFYKPAYRIDAYTIAQATLPKTYGDIVVRRRSRLGLFSFKPIGMTRVSLESQDFNKRFSVDATDIEKVTSLELLNPAYMEKLLQVPFIVNIEVVDNTVYLYSTDKKADMDTMLALLQNAFEEMKL